MAAEIFRRMKWEAKRLAAVAGTLRPDYPERSNFEIVATVWTTAAQEQATIGGILLSRRVRAKLESDRQRAPRR
jgi:hypothetical protein